MTEAARLSRGAKTHFPHSFPNGRANRKTALVTALAIAALVGLGVKAFSHSKEEKIKGKGFDAKNQAAALLRFVFHRYFGPLQQVKTSAPFKKTIPLMRASQEERAFFGCNSRMSAMRAFRFENFSTQSDLARMKEMRSFSSNVALYKNAIQKVLNVIKAERERNILATQSGIPLESQLKMALDYSEHLYSFSKQISLSGRKILSAERQGIDTLSERVSEQSEDLTKGKLKEALEINPLLDQLHGLVQEANLLLSVIREEMRLKMQLDHSLNSDRERAVSRGSFSGPL